MTDSPRTSFKNQDDRYYEWPERGTLPSVTTLLSRLPAQWLSAWYGKIIATEAVRSVEVLFNEAEEKYRQALYQALEGEPAIPFTIDRGVFSDQDEAVRRLKGLPNQTRDNAAAIGTMAHAAIRNYLEYGTEPDMLDEGYIYGAVSFLKDKGITPKRFELEMANFALSYAGTADVVGRDANDNGVVVDWKTGNRIYPKNAIQVMALMNCGHYLTSEMGTGDLPELTRGFIVHITEAGKYTPYEIKHDHAALMMETMKGLIPVMEFGKLKSSELWTCN